MSIYKLLTGQGNVALKAAPNPFLCTLCLKKIGLNKEYLAYYATTEHDIRVRERGRSRERGREREREREREHGRGIAYTTTKKRMGDVGKDPEPEKTCVQHQSLLSLCTERQKGGSRDKWECYMDVTGWSVVDGGYLYFTSFSGKSGGCSLDQPDLCSGVVRPVSQSSIHSSIHPCVWFNHFYFGVQSTQTRIGCGLKCDITLFLCFYRNCLQTSQLGLNVKRGDLWILGWIKCLTHNSWISFNKHMRPPIEYTAGVIQ